MDMFGGDKVTLQRAIGASENSHILPCGEVADLAGVHFRQGERHIPGDGGDAEKIDLGTGKRQQDGDSVILTRVGIDNQLLRRRHDQNSSLAFPVS